MASSSFPPVNFRPYTGPLISQAQTRPRNEQQEQRKKKQATEAGKNASWRRPLPPTPLEELKGPAHLVASVLPDGFPPELAYRALAAYSLLRTLSWQLRLSPFTPNVFLRALALPYPNRLLGQIHVCLLRILFPNLDLGYSYHENGGAVFKRKRIEEHDGVRVLTIPLIAGDNLTYLDGLSWPLFFDDYVHLTEDTLWRAMNSTELNVDFRNIALRNPTLDAVDESEAEEEVEIEQPKEHGPSLVECIGKPAADAAILSSTLSPVRGRGGRGRGLPTRKNRALNMALSKKRGRIASFESDNDSDAESDYDDKDDDSYHTPKKRKAKGKGKAKSQKRKRSASKGTGNPKSEPLPISSPGSRVIEVSMARGPGATIPLPLPPASLMLQPEHTRPSLNARLFSPGNRRASPLKGGTVMKPYSNIVSNGSSDARNSTGSITSRHPSLAPFHPNGNRNNVFQSHVASSSLHALSASTAAPTGTNGFIPKSGLNFAKKGVAPLSHFPERGALSDRVSSVERADPRDPTHLQYLHVLPPRREAPLPQQPPLHSARQNQIPHTRQPLGVPRMTEKKDTRAKQSNRPLHSFAKQSLPKTKGYEVSYDVADAINNFMTGKTSSLPPKGPRDPPRQMPSSQPPRDADHDRLNALTKTKVTTDEPRKQAAFESKFLGEPLHHMHSSQTSQQIQQRENQGEPDSLPATEASADVLKPETAFEAKPLEDRPNQIHSSQTSQPLQRDTNQNEANALAKTNAKTDEPRKEAGFVSKPPGDPLHQMHSSETPQQIQQPANQGEPDALARTKATSDEPRTKAAPNSLNGKVDVAESVVSADESFEQQNDSDTWAHFKPMMQMRRGIPYHRLPVEQKLNILEFLLDELLTVDFIAAEFSRRHCVTGCYGTPYGTLPTESELNTLENDDECVVCGGEGELLCCDGCTASYHRRCINVAIGSEIPEGTWLCADCKIVDPSQLGPLRGGKKCALDWFTLKDLEEASRLSTGGNVHSMDTGNATDFAVKTHLEEKVGNSIAVTHSGGLLNAGQLAESVVRLSDPPTVAGTPNPGVDETTAEKNEAGHLPGSSSEGSSLRKEGSHHDTTGEIRDGPQNNTGQLEGRPGPLIQAPPRDKDLDQMEFLVIHGFVFKRRRADNGTDCGCDEKGACIPNSLSGARSGSAYTLPLTQPELNKLLASIGQCLSLSWPLVQIPNRVWGHSSLLPRQKTNYGQYLSSPESFDPSHYCNRYRMAPLQRSKKHRCVGSQLNHLVNSEYETECASSATQKVSSVLSRDMSSDSCLAKELRVSTDLYNPYDLFTGYMLKLEGSLKSAYLLDAAWGTRNNNFKSGIWSMNVARCRSVRRLALLLVKLIDAANSRVFLEDWLRPPNHGSGKGDGESDSRIYLPLPPDWTPEAERRKRNLERSSYPQFHRLLVTESTTLDGQVEGVKFDTNKSITSGSRKRKHSKPVALSAAFIPTSHASKNEMASAAERSLPDAKDVQCRSTDWGSTSIHKHNPVTIVSTQVEKIGKVKAVSPSQPSTTPESNKGAASFNLGSSSSNKSAIASSGKASSPPLIASSATVHRKDDVRADGVGAQQSLVGGASVIVSHGKEKSGLPACVSEIDTCEQQNQAKSVVPSGAVVQKIEPTKWASSELRTSTQNGDSESKNMIKPPSVVSGRQGKNNENDDLTGEVEGDALDGSVDGTGTRGRPKEKKKKRDRELVQGRRRSRRSGRLRHRDEVHERIGSLVKGTDLNATDTKKGALEGKGMESLIAAELSSKIRMLEGLVRAPFDKELHWPMAGRLLFEPVGCLPPVEMKRLARNAGTVVAPYLTYNSSFEVGQAAVCHIWRKQTLQCNSFEKLLLQIRILDSFINKPAINTCESLGRRGASSKSQVQKVVRCTQRDLETGTTHYFVVNKRKFRGCWIPEDSVDLSALILELSNRREKALRRFGERKKLKLKEESNRLTQRLADANSLPSKVRTSVPNVTPSAPGYASNKPTSFSGRDISKSPRVAASKTTKKPANRPLQSKYKETECRMAMEKTLLQHQVATEDLLLECMKLGLSSIPEAKMNAARAKHMAQLKKAVALLKENGSRFEADAQLSESLVKSEAAATLRFQRSMSQAQAQRTTGGQTHMTEGTPQIRTGELSSKAGLNGGLSFVANLDPQGSLPLLAGQHLQGYPTSMPGGNLHQPWQIPPNQQQSAPSGRAHIGAVAALHSFSHQDQRPNIGQDIQHGQPGQFQSTQMYGFNGPSTLQTQMQGVGQQRQGVMPSGVGRMTPSQACFAASVDPGFAEAMRRTANVSMQMPGQMGNGAGRISPSQGCYATAADPNISNSLLPRGAGAAGQSYAQHNQLMNDSFRRPSNSEMSAFSPNEANWHGQRSSLNAGMSVPPAGYIDTAAANPYFMSNQQQLGAGKIEKHRNINPSSSMANRTASGMAAPPQRAPNPDYLSAMDFEPRSLEEMTKDTARR